MRGWPNECARALREVAQSLKSSDIPIAGKRCRDLVRSGFIDPIRTELEALRRAIAASEIIVRCRPAERSSPSADQDSTCQS